MMKHLFTTLLFCLLAATAVWAQSVPTYENGQKKYEGAIVKGKKTGEWKYFHDNGYVSREGVFQNDEPVGVWKEYYRTGQVKSEGKYVVVGGEGVKTGPWVTYHKNGAKEFEGKYLNGKAVGTWLEYNTLGIEIKKTNH